MRPLWPILALTALLSVPAARAETTRFEVMDRQGFEAPMVAYTLDIPQGWQAQGQIVWQKPCSGNEFYELVLTVTAPDGQSGLRVMPGHQIVWTDILPTRTMGDIGGMMRAQIEAERNRLRTAFQGSNCHVARITGGTDELIRALVLPGRPQGTVVDGLRRNEQTIQTYRQLFGPDMPGMRTLFDSVEITLRHPGAGGAAIREQVWLSWYMFLNDPTEANGGFLSQTAIVDTLRLSWRPEGRAQDDAVLEGIARSMTVGPDWQRRITEFHEKVQRDRRQQRDQDAAQREQDRLRREAQQDAQHQQFLDMIRQ